jgi:predicted RecA/RadA family phage recombinase
MSFDKGTVWVQDTYWIPMTAGANITKGQVVVLGSNGKVSPSAGANRNAIGVALTDIANGSMGPIAVRGIVWVTAGGAVSQGAFVTSGAGGKVVAFADFDAPSGGESQYYTTAIEGGFQTQFNKIGTVIGVALDGASADGDKIRIMLLRF